MPANLRKYGILALVPGIILVFSVLLKMAAGPYWLSTNFEGPYVYIVNGLDIISGKVPSDITHPGTPIELVSGAVTGLFNIGRSTPDLVTRVFKNPEYYLHLVFAFLTMLSFVTSWLLGWYVFHKTGDKTAAVLSQLPSLYFLVLRCYPSTQPVIPIVAYVGSETLLISVVNLFNICLLMNFFAATTRAEAVSSLWWGLVCGLGMAEKLIFIPLLAVPLVVISWKNKAIFICGVAASFVLWTLPIISRYPVIWSMITDYSSQMGGGHPQDAGMMEAFKRFYSILKDLVVPHWEIGLILCAALLGSLWQLVKGHTKKLSFYLLVLSAGILMQFAVITKHPGPQYLAPALGLCGGLLVLFFLQGISRNIWGRRLTGVFIIVFTLAGVWRAVDYRSRLAQLTRDIISFNEAVHAKYRGFTFLPFYRASGQAYALYWGDSWHGDPRWRDEMARLYPDTCFFNRGGGTNRIVSFGGRILSNDLLSSSSGVIFQGDQSSGDLGTDSRMDSSPFKVRLLERGRLESVYLLTSTTEKQALMSLLGAVHFLQQGDVSQALQFALAAKAYHYQPQEEVDNFILEISSYIKQRR